MRPEPPQAFFTTLLTNPLFWIALAIGVVVAAIYKWVQSVGGLKVAWLICVNAVLTAWDWVKIGFMTGVYFVMDLWNRLQLAFYTAGVNIQNFMGDMKARRPDDPSKHGEWGDRHHKRLH